MNNIEDFNYDSSGWAGPESPEVEQAKDEFADAQKAEILRQHISQYAVGAVKYGAVARDWVNGWLVRLGAQPVGGQSTYQINVRIDGSYGTTVNAGSRVEALEKFNQYVAAMLAAGQVRTKHCGEGVYGVTLVGEKPVFFSGPEDPDPQADVPVPDLTGLKAGIRDMLKEGITGHGWGYGYAQEQLNEMGLESLPTQIYRTVNVPVSGVAQMSFLAFEGDDDDEVMQSAVRAIVRTGNPVMVKPDEIGEAFALRPANGGDAGFALIDDEDDD